MIDFTTGETILVAILMTIGIILVLAPWWSLTNLGKLGDIAFELKQIRQELEKRHI